jgi:hypothetical protein
MINAVTFEHTVYADLPHRLEAGTPHIAGAVGLAEALRYLQSLGFDRVGAHEHELLAAANGPASSPSCSTACMRTTSPPFSTGLVWLSGQDTTAASR